MSPFDNKSAASTLDKELSFGNLISLCLKHWRLIGAVTLIFGIIAAVISLLMAPVFTAHVSLLPRQQQVQQNILGQLASLTNISLGEGSSYEVLYGQILTSDRMLERILEKQWMRSKGEESQSLMAILKPSDKPIAEDRMWIERERFKGHLRRSVISFERRNATGFMKIKVMVPRWPELAASLANELSSELDAYVQEISRYKASEQRRFITERLTQTRVDLDAASSALADFESLNRSFETSPLLRKGHAVLDLDVQIQTAMWIELKRQLEAAKIEENKDVVAIDVLDVARIPIVRSAPNRTLITLCGALLGCVFACAWILIRKHTLSSVS